MIPSPPPENSTHEPKIELSGLSTLIGVLLVAIMPAILVTSFGASWKMIGIGAAAWATAVAVKFPTSKLLKHVIFKKHTQKKGALATLQGLLSAMTELGVAAVCYAIFFRQPSLSNLIAFGIGASSIEIFFVLALGFIEEKRCSTSAVQNAWIFGAKQSIWVRYMMLIERFAALLVHVGSRGLVYLGLTHLNLMLFLIPVVSFSAVDGTACYGKLANWNWFQPKICRLFYVFVLVIGLLEVGLFTASAIIYCL